VCLLDVLLVPKARATHTIAIRGKAEPLRWSLAMRTRLVVNVEPQEWHSRDVDAHSLFDWRFGCGKRLSVDSQRLARLRGVALHTP